MNKQDFCVFKKNNLIVYFEYNDELRIKFPINENAWLNMHKCNAMYIKNNVGELYKMCQYVYGV